MLNSKAFRTLVMVAAAGALGVGALVQSSTPASAALVIEVEGGNGFSTGPGLGLSEAMGEAMTAGLIEALAELGAIQASMAEIAGIIESSRTDAGGGAQQQTEMHGFTCAGCYLAAIDHESGGDRIYVRNGTTYTYDFETDTWSQDGDATPSDLTDTDGDGHQDDADDGSEDPFGAEDGDEDDDGRQDRTAGAPSDPDGDGRQGIWDGAGCGSGLGQTCGVEAPTAPIAPTTATTTSATSPIIGNIVPVAHLPGKPASATGPALSTGNLSSSIILTNIQSVPLAPSTPTFK